MGNFEESTDEQIKKVRDEIANKKDAMIRDRNWEYLRNKHFPTQEVEEQIKRLIATGKKPTVLELGGGEGNAAQDLKVKYKDAIRMVVQDLVPPTKPKYIDTIFSGDISNIQLPDDSVDIAFSYQVTQYLLDKLRVLSEVSRILKVDGLFITDLHKEFTDPNFDKISDELIRNNKSVFDIKYERSYLRMIRRSHGGLYVPYKFMGKGRTQGALITSTYRKIG